MSREPSEEGRIRKLLMNHALLNAVKYGGKANPKAVAGKAFAEEPALKSRAYEIFRLAEEVSAEINAMPPDVQRGMAESLGLATVKEKPRPQQHPLPPLPNAERYPRIHVRFAPNPDSVIHLGNSRAAILSDEYAKIYRGIFTLRFEDTSPSIKPPQPEAYEAIKEDLKWLDVRWDNEVIQSDRLPVYYDYAERLLRIGGAYICTCPVDRFRELISEKKTCPCRDLPVDEQIARWRGMLEGEVKKGGAVMRVKTILDHPNPAIRDWPAMRIDTKPHPRIGTRYRVWPLYNFASGIDDHLLGITHILRGKEHEVNMARQKFMFEYFGWEYPEAIHYGRLKIEGTVLSKSKIRAGIESGIYESWDDPRLGTISALRRRGFMPEAIRRLILEVGVRPSEATISWENLSSINRKILDPVSKRYIFLADPKPMSLEGIEKEFEVSIPIHPDHPDWGSRRFKIGLGSRIIIQSSDLISTKTRKTPYLRLMNLFNVEITPSGSCRFHSEGIAEARSIGAPIIQWLPEGAGTPISVVKPDASRDPGLVDSGVIGEALPQVFQFYRYGFVRVCRSGNSLIGYFAHS